MDLLKCGAELSNEMGTVPIYTVLSICNLSVNPDFVLTGNMTVHATESDAAILWVYHQLDVLRITHLVDRGFMNAQAGFLTINGHNYWLWVVLCHV